MDKKLIAVSVVAFVLIVVGLFLMVTNPITDDTDYTSPDIAIVAHDFNIFTIDVPEGSNFTEINSIDGLRSYENEGKYSDEVSSIIVDKNMTDSLLGDNIQLVSNSTNEQIYSFVLKNKTSYKYVLSEGDVDLILTGDDLHVLKEMSNTFEIKDVNF